MSSIRKERDADEEQEASRGASRGDHEKNEDT